MKRYYFISLFVLFALGCDKKSKFDGPNTYSDDFENYASINDLIDGNDQRWSFFQVTSDSNFLFVDTTVHNSANRSVRCFAIASTDESTSKCSIVKENMAFWEDETVYADFWCYVAGNDPIDALYLFDIEEDVAVGGELGLRLAIINDRLRLERNFDDESVQQNVSTTLFPRNQWVHLQFQAALSRKDDGSFQVYRNDTLAIFRTDWQTLPKDQLYVTQGTHGLYNQIEFGITENSDDQSHVVYIDDVQVWVQ